MASCSATKHHRGILKDLRLVHDGTDGKQDCHRGLSHHSEMGCIAILIMMRPGLLQFQTGAGALRQGDRLFCHSILEVLRPMNGGADGKQDCYNELSSPRQAYEAILG